MSLTNDHSTTIKQKNNSLSNNPSQYFEANEILYLKLAASFLAFHLFNSINSGLFLQYIDRGMEYAEPRRKVEQFRQRIRREQIENIFAEQRERLSQQEESPIARELKQSFAKQKEFLDACSLVLTGDPSPEWQPVIDSLTQVTHIFQGEFEYWFTCSIIKSLCQAIKDSPPSLRLTPNICSLLSDMVSLASQHHTLFVQKLLEYEITSNVVRAGSCMTYSLWERMKILRFCSNLCGYSDRYQNEVIREGGGVFLVMLGQEIANTRVNDDDLCQSYLSLAFCFIKLSNTLVNLNVISKMVSLVCCFIFSPSPSDHVLALCFRIIAEILKYNREFIYISVCKFNGLLRRMVELAVCQSFSIRFNVILCICNLLYSDNPEIPRQLEDLGILDQLYASWALSQGQKNSFFQRSIMNLISNMVDSYKEFSNTVVAHRIFENIISQLQSSQLRNQQEAFFALNTIVYNVNANSLTKMIHNYDILHFIMLGLNSLKSVCIESTREIISSLRVIIQVSTQIYPGKENSVIGQLQGKYRLSNLLEDILQTSKDQFICHEANITHRMLTQQLWNTDQML